jgi:hypothetical protein
VSKHLHDAFPVFLRPDVTHGNESGNPGLVLDAEEVLANNSITATPLDEGRELLPVGRADIPRRNSNSPRRTVTSSEGGTVETYVQPDSSSIERYNTHPKMYADPPHPQPGRCYIQSEGMVIQVSTKTRAHRKLQKTYF